MQWGALALGIFAFVYFCDDLRAFFRPDETGLPTAETLRDQPAEAEDRDEGFTREVRLRSDANGHFVFKVAVNERLATLVADTGATYVVLTFEDARHLGLSPQSLDFSAPVQTANGITRVAPVTLDRVRIDDITVRNVPAAVAERGARATNLLGRAFSAASRAFISKATSWS
jgi:aspartyl protease family protein